MGAAILAAVGTGWFTDLKSCANAFVQYGKSYQPNEANKQAYQQLFSLYQQIYNQTKSISHDLAAFR